METRPLGKTDFEVSVLGFGGAPIGLLETKQAKVANILAMLLDNGVNLIDTAARYAGSEEAIGASISDRRNEFVLVSKCGTSGIPGEGWSAAALTENINNSLRKLRTDHVDVMLLHSCDMAALQDGEALGAVVAARDAGKVRYVGYSGDNEEAVYAAGLPDIAVIETSINICDQANIRQVLPVAVENNLGVIAKRPIANAAWKDLSQQEGFYADYASAYSQRFQAMGISSQELGFDADPAAAWPEIAVRFTLSQPGVSTAIIGTTNPAHVQANLTAVNKGPLPQVAVEKLQATFRRAEADSRENWQGLR